MSRSARVTRLDVLAEFKARLVEFAGAARQALSEGEADIQRTMFWLTHQQAAHWKRQIQKRTELVNQAKLELFRAQLQTQDTQGSCVLERKLVAKAERALEEAQTKSKAVLRWQHVLEREKMLYKAECQALGSAVNGDIPKAVAWIERMSDSLHAYVSEAPPQLSPAAAAEIESDRTPASRAMPADAEDEIPSRKKSRKAKEIGDQQNQDHCQSKPET